MISHDIHLYLDLVESPEQTLVSPTQFVQQVIVFRLQSELLGVQ